MAIRARVKKFVPQSLINQRFYWQGVRNLYRADVLDCNVCGYSGKFVPAGDPPRKNAMCPQCNSFERHRLVKLWLDGNPVHGSMLHFAPEPGLTALFKPRVTKYQSADLNPAFADTVLNIESIDLPDESVDMVLASHVLEHVDDAKALHEIRRILTPGGRAILMFPVIEGWDVTYEDSAITTPQDREKYFGQYDHVRWYGRDVRERIAGAGFELSEFTAEEPFVSKHGLIRGEKLFIAAT